jgi:transcriptional regulator with XRE-family HTH domain
VAGDLASTVRTARLRARLSQAQLAKRAGISASYLSRIESAAWERGGPWPADGVLRALARALSLSSTELIGMRNRARAALGRGPGGPEGVVAVDSGPAYAVGIGADEVDAAARRLVDRNPRHGTFRSVHVASPTPATAARREEPPSTYVDALAARLAASDETLLYRVCAPARGVAGPEPVRAVVDRQPAANIRARVAFNNPLVMDVLIGEHEALIALPDRRGHPHLAACVVVDDPDFVEALRRWYDEWVWEPPGSPDAATGDGLRPS